MVYIISRVYRVYQGYIIYRKQTIYKVYRICRAYRYIYSMAYFIRSISLLKVKEFLIEILLSLQAAAALTLW